MSDTSIKTTGPAGATERLQLILRPKNLVAGLNPEYTIDAFPSTIGRHPTNDIELPFEAVSRYHARIELHEGRPRLVDLRSSNGSYVNQKRVQIAPLMDQDAVGFGSLEFALTVNNDAPCEVARSGEEDQTSVHFVQQDEGGQMVYHRELPDDTSHASALTSDITNEAQLQQAKERLITLYRLQEVLRSTTDEETLLRGVLELVFDVLPVERAVVLTRDDADASVFRPIAIKTKGPGGRHHIGISKTILQRCLTEKVAILTRDATQDSRFKSSESIIAQRMKSVMCVPLISVRHVFGFCHLDTTDAIRSFTEEDLAFLANVGAEVATHLHNLRMLHEKITSERMAAIGQTITGMAHNIKNILVLSQGGIEMMEKRLNKKNYDALEETWGVVRRGLDRINRLVQDMLDYSRSRTIEKKKVRLTEFIQELHETFSSEISKRGIQFKLDLDETVPPLMLDPDGLDKALCNLIVNAMEACADDAGMITLRSSQTPEKNVVIEVEDNAGGIPKEVLPRIFVPFFTTKGSKGSGLGLAMTKKFIEDMGGKIDVDTREGEGTRFVITLYVAPSEPKIAPAESRTSRSMES